MFTDSFCYDFGSINNLKSPTLSIMKNLLKSSILLAAALASGAAFSDADPSATSTVCIDMLAAGNLDSMVTGMCSTPEGTGASKRTDKRVYMGLVWSFGQNANKTPDVLVGFRSTQVKSSNAVKGADLSLRLQASKNFAVEGVRLSYLGGNRNALANIGGGYSFAKSSALITAAVQAAHIRAGTDYLLANQIFAPYFEVNTLKRIQPTGTNYSCSTGNLRTIDNNFNYSDYIADPVNFFANLGTGLISPGADLTDYPFMPAGTKTCFQAPEPDPV